MMTDQALPGEQGFDSEGFRAGSFVVFRQFFLHSFPDFFAFAHLLIPDKIAAKNIVSDAFFLLWNKRADLDSLTNIKAFLYLTIRNSSVSYLRQKQDTLPARPGNLQSTAGNSLPGEVVAELQAFADGFGLSKGS